MRRSLFNVRRFFKRKNIPILTWFVWILSGTIFYWLYDEFPLYVAVYKSTSVGWALGWSLPLDTRRADDSVSMLFSSAHNCVGVVFVGLSTIYIAKEIANSKDDWTVQITNRQHLKDLEVTGLGGRLQRWYLLHKSQVRLVAVTLGLIWLCIGGGYVAVQEYSFAQAADVTLATISCCGYAGLPEGGEQPVLYFMLASYTNLAVPVFAIALASLISLVGDTPDEKFFYSKIAAPLKQEEIKYMQAFGIDDGDGLLDAKEFVVLTIIRIGTVPPGLVLDVIRGFREVATAAEEEGAREGAAAKMCIPYSSIEGYARATSLSPPLLSSFQGGMSAAGAVFARSRGSSGSSSSSLPADSSTSTPTITPSTSSVAPAPSLSSSSALPPPLIPYASSASEALNRRRQRRASARKSLLQLRGGQQGRDRDLHAVLAARAGVASSVQAASLLQAHLVPVKPAASAAPRHKHPHTRVAPDAAVLCGERHDEETENKQDCVLLFGQNDNDGNNDADTKDDDHHAPSTLLPSSMLEIHEEEDEEEEEEQEEEEDDQAYDEIRPPSEIGTPQDIVSRKSNPDKPVIPSRTPSLSMDMNRDSFSSVHDKPNGIIYKNKSVLKRRTERRDTFIPSGTYEILSIQNRRKSAIKLQRKKTLARVVAQPSLLAKSARNSTVGLLKKKIGRRATLRASTLTHVDKINAAHLNLIRQHETLQQRVDESEDLCFVCFSLLLFTLRDPYVQAFLAWLLWLLLAALFYCLKMDLSFYRGFYMSVNVGYAIYWTQEESDVVEKVFSVCHIIFGQIMFSFALAAFAKGLTNSTQEWYSAESAKQEVSSARFSLSKGSSMVFQWSIPKGEGNADSTRGATSSSLVPVQTVACGYLLNVFLKLQLFYSQQKVHLFLLLWLVFGVVWSSVSVGWPVVEGLYFAVTALSTGGIWAIPEDSSDLQHFVVAVWTCTGAPIMVLSGGVFAHWLSTLGEAAHLRRTMRAAISLGELRMMNTLDIDDGDGFIDQTEYIILILVRVKAIRPELIAAILARFRHLDAGGLGAVPYEIFQWSNTRTTITSTPPPITPTPAAAATTAAVNKDTDSANDNANDNNNDNKGEGTNESKDHGASDDSQWNVSDDNINCASDNNTSDLIQIID